MSPAVRASVIAAFFLGQVVIYAYVAPPWLVLMPALAACLFAFLAGLEAYE